MKMTLKVIALFLAIGASAQTIVSYAEDIENLPELISQQEELLVDLLSGHKAELWDDGQADLQAVEAKKKEVIIKNMIHYVRLVEGQKELLEELKKQQFPDLNINEIWNGRHEPGI